MKIIGIGWHLCSTVSLFDKDRISYISSEERFSRLKNDDSFPIKALRNLLRFNNLRMNDIDYFAITSKTCPGASELIKSYSQWSVQDYLKQQNDYWFPKIYKNKNMNELNVMKKSFKLNDIYKKKLLKNLVIKILITNF